MERKENHEESMETYFYPCAGHGALPEPCRLRPISDDVAGEDWRTTGVVVGSGTITHDGESVDVLVTADPNSAAFYRDQEEQVLFDSVAFPETIEDINSSAFQISFDDQNGDEESDVLVKIGHEDMSNTTMLWLWDPQERYVYQPDYSSFHVPGWPGRRS